MSYLELSLPGTFTVDLAADDGTPKRTISGVALEYGVEATDMHGTKVRFEPGALPLDGAAPKLTVHEHRGRTAGIVAERVEVDNQVLFTAKISKTQLGDEALELAADGVLDSVSVGVQPTDYSYEGNTLVVKAATWHELALVPFGAFDMAKVTTVAAAAPTTQPSSEGEHTTMDNNTQVVEAATPEAIIPTQPILFAAPAAPEIDAATYLSHVASGKSHPAIEAAQQGTADSSGILPDPLVGEVYGQLDQVRSFVSAVGTLAHPNLATWYRRKVTQHTAVDRQAGEFNPLASQKMKIERLLVESETFGGYIDLSEQEIDFTDPAALALTLNDMAGVYADTTEAWACELLESGATVTDSINFADGDEILDALYDGSATIYAATKRMPRLLCASPDAWATLGKAKADNGDRIFPIINPMNAGGQMSPNTFVSNVGNFQVVVSGGFSAGTLILVDPRGIELYEQRKGSIQLARPEELSVRLAFRGYFTGKVIDSGAFVKFEATV